MKNFLIIGLACLALSTTACAGVTVGPPPGPIVSTRGTLVDNKAYGEALVAYNAASDIYLAIVDTPLLSPAKKAVAKPALQVAYRALRTARAAIKAGEADTLSGQLTLAMIAIEQAQAVLPKKGS